MPPCVTTNLWQTALCSRKQSQQGEPTKKAMRGMRPRMAFVSLADVTGADQTPMSPAESDSIIRRWLKKKKPRFARLLTTGTEATVVCVMTRHSGRRLRHCRGP